MKRILKRIVNLFSKEATANYLCIIKKGSSSIGEYIKIRGECLFYSELKEERPLTSAIYAEVKNVDHNNKDKIVVYYDSLLNIFQAYYKDFLIAETSHEIEVFDNYIKINKKKYIIIGQSIIKLNSSVVDVSAYLQTIIDRITIIKNSFKPVTITHDNKGPIKTQTKIKKSSKLKENNKKSDKNKFQYTDIIHVSGS